MYQVLFAKPIDKRLLIEIDLLAIDPKKDECLDKLYLLTKEGYVRGAPVDLRDRQDASSRSMISALLLNNDAVISTIRRELRRVVDVGVDEEVILAVLRDEVIKRETLEGPSAEQAARRVTKRADKPLRSASKPVPGADPECMSNGAGAAPAPSPAPQRGVAGGAAS